MDAERGLEIGVVCGEGTGGGVAQREGLEDGPVVDGMAVARAVEDAVEPATEDDEGGFLGELARPACLEDRGVDFREAEGDGGGRELAAQQSDPLGRVDIGVLALGFCGADQTSGQPACRHGAERCEVVWALDRGELSEQGEVWTKAGERLQKAADTPAGGIDDAVVGLRIVEAVAEGAVGVSVGPVRGLPGVGPAADAMERGGGIAKLERIR